MNNIISYQENKFKQLDESYKKLLNSLDKCVSPSLGERLLLINSKIDDIQEEIENLQYECDKGDVKEDLKAKERIVEYERNKQFIDKMFPLLFVIYTEMCKVNKA